MEYEVATIVNVSLRYGRGWVEAELPEKWHVEVLAPAGHEPVSNVQAAVVEALDRPIGLPPLSDRARGRDWALVVVSDITRPVPNALLMPALLERLESAGVPASRVVVLIATGLHRPATKAEIQELLGEETVRAGVQVVSHRAREVAEHQSLGKTTTGVPVTLDRRYLEAPLRIVVGLVEPHFMAGFSGGPKSLCPGLASAETIMGFHSPALLSHERVAPGVTEGNLFLEEIRRVAERAGEPELCVNFVLDAERRIVGVFGGRMGEVHKAAIARARETLTARLSEPADLVLTSGGGYPLDLTFYQGVKGIVAGVGAARPGGCVIVFQQNAEGAGSAEFASLLASCDDPAVWPIDCGRNRAQVIDEWEMVELAKAARRARIINVCPDAPASLRELVPIPTVNTLEEALDLLVKTSALDCRSPKVAVMPDGPYTLVQCDRKT